MKILMLTLFILNQATFGWEMPQIFRLSSASEFKTRYEQLTQNDEEFRSALKAYTEVTDFWSSTSPRRLDALFTIQRMMFADPYAEQYVRRLKAIEARLFYADETLDTRGAQIYTELILSLQDNWTTLFMDRIMDPEEGERSAYYLYSGSGLIAVFSSMLLLRSRMAMEWVGWLAKPVERVTSIAGDGLGRTVRKALLRSVRGIANPIDLVFRTESTSHLARAAIYLGAQEASSKALKKAYIRARLQGQTLKPFPAPLKVVSLIDGTDEPRTPLSHAGWGDIKEGFIFPLSLAATITADRYAKRSFRFSVAKVLQFVKWGRASGFMKSIFRSIPRTAIYAMERGAAIRSAISIPGIVGGAIATYFVPRLFDQVSDDAHLNLFVLPVLNKQLQHLKELKNPSPMDVYREANRTYVLLSERLRYVSSPILQMYEDVMEEYVQARVCTIYQIPSPRAQEQMRLHGVFPPLPNSIPSATTPTKVYASVLGLAELHNREQVHDDRLLQRFIKINDLAKSEIKSQLYLLSNFIDWLEAQPSQEDLKTVRLQTHLLETLLTESFVEDLKSIRDYRQTGDVLDKLLEMRTSIAAAKDRGLYSEEAIEKLVERNETLPQEYEESARYYAWKELYRCFAPYEPHEIIQ